MEAEQTIPGIKQRMPRRAGQAHCPAAPGSFQIRGNREGIECEKRGLIATQEHTEPVLDDVRRAGLGGFAVCSAAFFPIIKLFYMSLFNWNMASGVHKFLGFRNFVEITASATFLSALWRTIYIGFEILLITVPLGLLIANAIHRKIWAKGFVQTGLFYSLHHAHGPNRYYLEVVV